MVFHKNMVFPRPSKKISVADWPRVLGQQIQLPMMTYVIDVNQVIVAISCMLS